MEIQPTAPMTQEDHDHRKVLRAHDKLVMERIKLMQKGVKGVEMRTPDLPFGFGDENGYEDEVEVYSIRCPINPNFRKKLNTDYKPEEMTPEQREVFEALFEDDEEEELQKYVVGQDEDGRVFKSIVETGDDLEGFVEEAMGGELPVFIGLQEEAEKEEMSENKGKGEKKPEFKSLIEAGEILNKNPDLQGAVTVEKIIDEPEIKEKLYKLMDAESSSSEEEEEDEFTQRPHPSVVQTPYHLEKFQLTIKNKNLITDKDFPALGSGKNFEIPMSMETENLMDNEIEDEIVLENKLNQVMKEQYKEDEEGNETSFKGNKKISDLEFDAILDNHLQSMGQEGKKVLKKLNEEGKQVVRIEDEDGKKRVRISEEDNEVFPIKKKKKKREQKTETRIMPGGGMMIIRYGVKKKRNKRGGRARIPTSKGIYRMHFEQAINQLMGAEPNDLALQDQIEEEQEQEMMEGGLPEGTPGLDMDLERQVMEDDPELKKFLEANGLDGEYDLDVDYEDHNGLGFEIGDIGQNDPNHKKENDWIKKYRLHERLDFEERIERDKMMPDYIKGFKIFKRKLLPKLTYEQDKVYQEALKREKEEVIDFSKPPEIFPGKSIKEPLVNFTPYIKIQSKEEALKDANVVRELKEYGKSRKSKRSSRKTTEDFEDLEGDLDGYDGWKKRQEMNEVLEEEREDVGHKLQRRGKKLTKEEKKRRKEEIKKMKKERREKKQNFKKKFQEAKKTYLSQRDKRIEANSLNGLSVYKIN